MEAKKRNLADMLEDLASDILTSTSCPLFWGEVSLPEILKNEIENKEGDMRI